MFFSYFAYGMTDLYLLNANVSQKQKIRTSLRHVWFPSLFHPEGCLLAIHRAEGFSKKQTHVLHFHFIISDMSRKWAALIFTVHGETAIDSYATITSVTALNENSNHDCNFQSAVSICCLNLSYVQSIVHLAYMPLIWSTLEKLCRALNMHL